jgi:type IV pilus assembly protein PilY1
MKLKNILFIQHKQVLFPLLMSASLMSQYTFSAPGTLQDAPLTVSTSVQPNILFLLDDSGSMDWEQLISQEARTAYGVDANGRAASLNFAPTSDVELNELCVRYNVMAYDPNVVYEPWSGLDEDGLAYSDMSLANALDNPYENDVTVDVSSHVYSSWVDTNSNTVLDVGECGNISNITAADLTPGTFTVYNIETDASTTDDAGYLTDSGGENGDYGNNEDDNFIINPIGTSHDFTIDFSVFAIEDQATCVWDNLAIDRRDFGAASWTQVGDLYCGFDVPPTITINGTNQIRVRFDTDGSVTEPGFILFWNHSTSGSATPDLGAIDLAACRADANCTVVSDLPTNATAGAGVTNTQENYANWYTYYRKREYVAKKAMSDIISSDDNRLGLATLHNNDNVGTIIQDMRDTTTPNRQSLLDNLFQVRSSGGTPLRESLEEVGMYFEEGTNAPNDLFGFTPSHTGTIASNTPILTEATGGVCQQNFAVVFSDGFWNGGDPSVGDQDSDDAGNAFDGGTFADTFGGFLATAQSNTLADVAMRYLKEDLSSSLANNSNVVDARDNTQTIPHQHMTTYTVAFGIDGELSANPGEAGFDGWRAPAGNALTTVDDMRHAAWNGRGLFLNANNPQELIDSFTQAINDIGDRTATATAASVSSGFISSETLIFQSQFNTDGWSGDLLAYQFDNNGVVDRNADSVIDENDAIWRAASNLSTRIGSAGHTDRDIFTFNGAEGLEFTTAAVASYNTLLTDGNDNATGRLSDYQIRELLARVSNPDTIDAGEIVANQTEIENMVNYLRGDNANESDLGYRERNGNYLGAIINSSAQYVGAPNDIYPDDIETGTGNEYSTFVANNTTRRPVVYVGSNSGMLHAFDASLAVDTSGNVTVPGTAGDELFAYMPSNLFNNTISNLANQNYSFQAFVDATPTIRDVFIPHEGSDQWRTLLVGGLRSGGQGIYILDVTDPENFSEANVLAEFSHPELGFTYGRPQIVKMNNGRWAAVFGNGYNSAGCNGTASCGEAKLFILYLDDLADGIDSSDYVILRTSTNMSASVDAVTLQNQLVSNNSCLDANSDCNGLSAPAVADLDGNFTLDRVYAGDVHGQLWVFNLENNSSSNWEVGFNGEPLFTACSSATCTAGLPAPAGGAPGVATGNRQPITVQPQIALHPSRRSVATAPNILVYFSTGQFITTTDGNSDDTAIQSMYGVWDAGYSSSDTSNGNLNRSNLVQQTYSGTLGSSSISNNAVTYQTGSGGDYGWYINFELNVSGNNVLAGTRSYITPVLIGRVVFFVGTQPGGDICNRDGTSFLAALDSFDGTQAGFFIFDTDNDGIADSSAPLRELAASIVGLESVGADPKLVGTEVDGGITVDDVSVNITVPAGRKSWTIIK